MFFFSPMKTASTGAVPAVVTNSKVRAALESSRSGKRLHQNLQNQIKNTGTI